MYVVPHKALTPAFRGLDWRELSGIGWWEVAFRGLVGGGSFQGPGRGGVLSGAWMERA